MTLLWASKPRLSLPRWPVVWGFTLALLGSGVLLSTLLFIYVRSWERRGLQGEINARAAERVEVLRNKITASMDVLQGIGSLFATRNKVSRLEFAAFVASALTRQPELKALGWTPRVFADERAGYETAARRMGCPGFSLSSATPRAVSFRRR